MSRVRHGVAIAACTTATVATAAPALADEGGATRQADPITNLLAPKSLPTTGGPAATGSFSPPFVEPTIGGQTTSAKCVDGKGPNGGKLCKPAAGSLVQLADGRILFWDALEGTENNKFSIVSEGGSTFTNDSSRLIDLSSGTPQFSTPNTFDGGANRKGDPGEPLIPGGQSTETYNDGALFGSHQSFLPDGSVLVQGGTDYSADPGADGIPFGTVELTGIKSTRIFDPKVSDFRQSGDTNKRRWYPTLVAGGNGKYYDFSGVQKLLKPVYKDRPEESGTNVKQVEAFDPATEKWTDQGAAAQRDLPLYPRMHLLPNGNIFYNADGQDFNPFGQSTGEAGWNDLASFDPDSKTWTDLGLANQGTLTPGFRGSTSSTMLPLEPDANGNYTKTRLLTAGGVLGTSPGSVAAVANSDITTVDTSAGKAEKVSTEETGPLNQRRWFGQNVVLPTGDVMVFSGADKDEVVGPGSEFPVQQAEMFDVAAKKWIPMATANNPRTYHNTAVLMPSGEVLVGGHATISTGYLNNTTLPGGFAPHDGRDPSFEVYHPPYLDRGPRPVIAVAPNALDYGGTFTVELGPGVDAAGVESVRISRNTAITHIVDADQRQVVLPVVGRQGQTITVKAPPNANVAPAGPYMLFVNGKTDKGPVPSVAKQLLIGPNAAKYVVANAKAARAAKACASKRSLTVHAPKRYRGKLAKVAFFVGGTRVKNQGSKARVTLSGRTSGTFTVRIIMRTRSGKRVVDTRRYRTCTSGAAYKAAHR